MANPFRLIDKIALRGLRLAPSQSWGAVRLVPLLRPHPRTDLRLFKRSYTSDVAIVSLEKDLHYLSYVPHGLVLNWSADKTPIASWGGQLLTEGKQLACGPTQVQLLHRMAKREGKNALRLLPLHLAMEGFLSMFFKGPTLAWPEYSKQAFSQGLSPRTERSISGRAIIQLEEALRLFEIHETQVGVLLFVADQLASVFLVPTPEDYRALHSSLLEDFYGETFYYHGLYGAASPLEATLDDQAIETLADLQAAVQGMRRDWATLHRVMAEDLLGRSLSSQKVYTAGPFSLQRFMTDLALKQSAYIGEVIVDDLAHLQYLKIYSLSASQVKRAYLLQQLAAHGWNLELTARSQGETLEELVTRLENVGFGYLINHQVREKAVKAKKLPR